MMEKVRLAFLPVFLLVSLLPTWSCNRVDESKKEAWAEAEGLKEGAKWYEAGNDEFVILGWVGLKDDLAKPIQFRPMRQCGFNTYLCWISANRLKAVLDHARDAGVKVLPHIAADEIGTVIPQIKDHPALYGYYLKDEPEITEFSALGREIAAVKGLDTDHPCYINVYPSYYNKWTAGYPRILREYIRTVGVPFLSFDYYPVLEVDKERVLRPGWYACLEDVRSVSREFQIPFWAFALASSHRPSAGTFYPQPTVEELRLQQFSNLLYGAQGFQYFTYWALYQEGPTEVYPRVKTVNRELQAMAFIFKDADVTDVRHTGASIPEGTRALDGMPAGIKSLVSGDAGVIVSTVEKGGRHYVAILNKDFKLSQKVHVELDARYRRFSRTGAASLPSLESSLDLTLEPSDLIVFEILQ